MMMQASAVECGKEHTSELGEEAVYSLRFTSSVSTVSRCLALAGVLISLARPARANFTATGGSSETNTLTILDTIYNGGASTFVGDAFGGELYTSGIGIALRRVDDFGSPSGTLNILSGHGNTVGAGTSTGTDQVWSDGIAFTSGEAKFAGYSQAFGFTDVTGYHELFEVPAGGSGFFPPNAYDFTVDLTGTQWRWDRSDANGNSSAGPLHWSSDESLNSDDLDHLISYEVLGLGNGARTWLLFWDDQFSGGDRDFNDLVVQVSAIKEVPVPGAVWLAAAGLISAVGIRWRRAAIAS